MTGREAAVRKTRKASMVIISRPVCVGSSFSVRWRFVAVFEPHQGCTEGWGDALLELLDSNHCLRGKLAVARSEYLCMEPSRFTNPPGDGRERSEGQVAAFGVRRGPAGGVNLHQRNLRARILKPAEPLNISLNF
jgi:hypothetical protein